MNVAIDLLEERGPGLGRPLVDTRRGSVRVVQTAIPVAGPPTRAGRRSTQEEGGLMTEFHDRDDIRADGA